MSLSDIFKSTPLSSMFYNPSADEDKITEGLQKGNAAYDNLVVPTYQSVDYAGPEAAADVGASPIDVERVGPSSYEGISLDPGYKEAQLAQLAALQELRDNGGMNAADKANLSKIATDEANREKASREAIMQKAQMRGTGGSNLALVDMLMAAQQGANRQSQRDLGIAGMAQDRALNAGNAAAGLAGNMGSQEFSEAAQVAAAKDAAAKFNAQLANQGAQFNAGQQMQAALANQGKNQNVNNLRAQASNQSQEMNKFTMPQATYAAQLQKAAGQAGQGAKQADIYANQMAASKRAQGGIWGGGLQMGMGLLKNASFGGGGGGGATGGTSGGSQSTGNVGGAGNDYQYGSYGDDYGDQEYNIAYGGKVGGEACVPGDSEMNDTVRAKLSPGEVVVPRSLTHASSDKIANFVHNAPDADRLARIEALKKLRG